MNIDLNTPLGKLVLAGVVVLALGLIYFVWAGSATPDPVIPPGQSISNPMGGRENAPRHKGP